MESLEEGDDDPMPTLPVYVILIASFMLEALFGSVKKANPPPN